MTDKYPPLHYQIVNDLLEGKFLLIDDDKKFQTLKENRNEYILFFEKTLGAFRKFQLHEQFTPNPKKCEKCIYRNLCDKSPL